MSTQRMLEYHVRKRVPLHRSAKGAAGKARAAPQRKLVFEAATAHPKAVSTAPIVHKPVKEPLVALAVEPTASEVAPAPTAGAKRPRPGRTTAEDAKLIQRSTKRRRTAFERLNGALDPAAGAKASAKVQSPSATVPAVTPARRPKRTMPPLPAATRRRPARRRQALPVRRGMAAHGSRVPVPEADPGAFAAFLKGEQAALDQRAQQIRARAAVSAAERARLPVEAPGVLDFASAESADVAPGGSRVLPEHYDVLMRQFSALDHAVDFKLRQGHAPWLQTLTPYVSKSSNYSFTRDQLGRIKAVQDDAFHVACEKNGTHYDLLVRPTGTVGAAGRTGAGAGAGGGTGAGSGKTATTPRYLSRRQREERSAEFRERLERRLEFLNREFVKSHRGGSVPAGRLHPGFRPEPIQPAVLPRPPRSAKTATQILDADRGLSRLPASVAKGLLAAAAKSPQTAPAAVKSGKMSKLEAMKARIRARNQARSAAEPETKSQRLQSNMKVVIPEVARMVASAYQASGKTSLAKHRLVLQLRRSSKLGTAEIDTGLAKLMALAPTWLRPVSNGYLRYSTATFKTSRAVADHVLARLNAMA